VLNGLGDRFPPAQGHSLRERARLQAVVPVKAYLNAPAHNDEALPNTTFRATEMAGSSVLGSARFIRLKFNRDSRDISHCDPVLYDSHKRGTGTLL
jgi:hypothetical protein